MTLSFTLHVLRQKPKSTKKKLFGRSQQWW